MRRFVIPITLCLVAACAKHTASSSGPLPLRDAALDCAQEIANGAGFVPAPRDNALGASVQTDRREFLRWSPPGHWQDANEIQRISAWVVPRGDSVGIRTDSFVMRRPSSSWTTPPEEVRTLAARMEASCTGKTPSS
jgi:hypothetical protein